MQTNPISIKDELSQISKFWSPRVIGTFNDSKVILAKCAGKFPWHVHKTADEMFQVLSGELTIEFEDKKVTLKKGECAFVYAGQRHQTYARGETHILLIEKTNQAHTGD